MANHYNLYSTLSLDSAASSDSLNTECIAKLTELHSQGVPQSDPRVQELFAAQAILGNKKNKAIYDRALSSEAEPFMGIPDLQYLAARGRLPDRFAHHNHSEDDANSSAATTVLPTHNEGTKVSGAVRNETRPDETATLPQTGQPTQTSSQVGHTQPSSVATPTQQPGSSTPTQQNGADALPHDSRLAERPAKRPAMLAAFTQAPVAIRAIVGVIGIETLLIVIGLLIADFSSGPSYNQFTGEITVPFLTLQDTWLILVMAAVMIIPAVLNINVRRLTALPLVGYALTGVLLALSTFNTNHLGTGDYAIAAITVLGSMGIAILLATNEARAWTNEEPVMVAPRAPQMTTPAGSSMAAAASAPGNAHEARAPFEAGANSEPAKPADSESTAIIAPEKDSDSTNGGAN